VSKTVFYLFYLICMISSYGPKGSAIIQSTLMRMLDRATTPPDGFAPLSMGQFTQLVLVPYVARLLIMDDMDCSLQGAYEEMVDSRDAGQHLYPEDDDDLELETILHMNVREATKERAARLRTDADIRVSVLHLPTHDSAQNWYRLGYQWRLAILGKIILNSIREGTNFRITVPDTNIT